jgi:DNA-binding transcriptional MocR family regulator
MSVNKLASSAQGLQSSAIRELLKHSKMAGVISLGGGIPNPDLFDHEGLKIAADAVLSQHFGEAFQYGLTKVFRDCARKFNASAKGVVLPVRPMMWLLRPVRSNLSTCWRVH